MQEQESTEAAAAAAMHAIQLDGPSKQLLQVDSLRQHCTSVTGSSLMGSKMMGKLNGKAVGQSPVDRLTSSRQMRVSWKGSLTGRALSRPSCRPALLPALLMAQMLVKCLLLLMACKRMRCTVCSAVP